MKLFKKVIEVHPATLGGEVVKNKGEICWKVKTVLCRAKTVGGINTSKKETVIKTVWSSNAPELSSNWG
jgi:hypothetical protein